MHGDERFAAVIKRQRPSAHLADGRRTAEHAPRSRSAKRDDHSGLHDRPLQILPPVATLDLVGVGPLVQSPFAAHFIFEMLDRVGDEDAFPLDAGFFKGAVQNAARRTDEGQTGLILLITRLLADQHYRCAPRRLPGHRLAGVLGQRTATALVLGRTQRGQRSDEQPIVRPRGYVKHPTHTRLDPIAVSPRNKSTETELVSQPRGELHDGRPVLLNTATTFMWLLPRSVACPAIFPSVSSPFLR